MEAVSTQEEHPFHPSHWLTLADQDAFRAARQDGLYSTDSVAILQLSKYGSPLSVYLDKVEPLAPSTPVSLQAWLGWRLEDTLAQLYAERYGVDTPMRMSGTYTHPTLEFIKTHLDYADGAIIVEGKTRTRMSQDWGEDGSGKVPPDVWVQCQHELLACPLMERVRIPVLFGLHTFHVYEVARHPEFQAGLMVTLDDFWHDHVLAKVPPVLTAMPWDVTYSKRHEMLEPALEQATPEMEPLFQRAREAYAAARLAKAGTDAVNAQVRELIGTKAGIQGLFGKVTYKPPANGETDWKLLAATYRKAIEALVAWAGRPMPVDELDLINDQVEQAKGLYTKPGSRTIRWAFTDEGATDE